MSTVNQWIVGLDLNARSQGALVFASWLGAAGDAITGVHVVEEWRRRYVQGDVLPAVEAAVTDAARQRGCAPPGTIVTFDASTAELSLARAAEGAAGLILGRAGGEPGKQLVRLGSVARKLLRELPAPVVVVPPTLAAVPGGPVLLATDLGPASAGAVRFAIDFAARRGRPLELVHVGEAFHSEDNAEPEPAWVVARAEYRAEVTQQVDAWCTAHNLAAVPRHIVYGDAVLELTALAEARAAPLVVVGSRRLGLAARFFVGSTASALASVAPCAVAVVAPPE